MCVSISGIPGEPNNLLAYVNDRCPECLTGAIDLGWTGDGRFPITWKAVDCPVIGNLQYLFQGSQPFYMKLQVRNNKIPISTLEFGTPSGSWITGTRTQDNFFECPSYPYPVSMPLKVRVTGIDGESLIDQIQSISMTPFDGQVGVQFKGISSGSATAPTNPPTKAPTNAPTKAPTQAPTNAPKAPVPTNAPTKAPTNAPTKAPTQAPTNAPKTTTGGTCPSSLSITYNDDWWIEASGPAGLPSVSIRCSDGHTVPCVAEWGKYVCDPLSTACYSPHTLICGPSGERLAEDTSDQGSFPVGAIVGISIGGFIVVVLLVAAIVYIKTRPESAEHI